MVIALYILILLRIAWLNIIDLYIVFFSPGLKLMANILRSVITSNGSWFTSPFNAISDNDVREISMSANPAMENMKSGLVPKEDRRTVGEKRVKNPRMRCENIDVYYNGGKKKRSMMSAWILDATKSLP